MSYKSNISVIIFIAIIFAVMPILATSQVTLDANGPGQTYELINSVLAPGYTAVEAPDQCTSHPSFGRHIAEVWDATLNKYVFEFYIHVPTSFPVTATTADNDRCINFDRQRVEIKTYESSPANLKGTVGETVNYKWKFRLPLGFRPSPNFTHIHQVKAVGGDEGDPLFTLTVRKSNPDILQSLYVKDSATSEFVQGFVNLSSIAGIWIEATEVIKVGANGTYSITLKRVSDSVTLLSYNNANVATIRPSNTFIRPKWGIYRSLNSYSYLRDDTIRLANISIQEGVLPVHLTNFTASIINKKIELKWSVENEINFSDYEIEYSNNGIGFNKIGNVKAATKTAYNFIYNNNQPKQFYRLKLIDKDGRFSYSNIISLFTNDKVELSLYPNPAKNCITISTNELHSNSTLIISDAVGVVVKKTALTNAVTIIETNKFLNGIYHIQLLENNQIICNNTFVIAR